MLLQFLPPKSASLRRSNIIDHFVFVFAWDYTSFAWIFYYADYYTDRIYRGIPQFEQ